MSLSRDESELDPDRVSCARHRGGVTAPPAREFLICASGRPVRGSMDFSEQLVAQLAQLSVAVADDGSDVWAILEVLSDDLVAAVPSYLGLTVTMFSRGLPVTFTTVDSSGDLRVGSSLLLPLFAMEPIEPGAALILFAANAGAFVDLAADTRWAYRVDTQVEVDQHLTAVGKDLQSHLLSAGLDAFTNINQAIGVLMAQGFDQEEATAELRHRAEAGNLSPHRAARRILDDLP